MDVKILDIPKLKLDRSYFIFSTHPTRADMDRARMEEKLVVVMVHKPGDTITTISEGDAFCDGLLRGWGISSDSRLIVLAVPQDKDLEVVREWWVGEMLKDLPVWSAPAGLNRTTKRTIKEKR